MNGQLRDYPLAELIREISTERMSGALRLARERVKAAVYFEAGEIVSARSNLRVHRLAECLRRWGVVAEDRLAKLTTDSMSDTETAAALVAGGVLQSDEIEKHLSRQAAEVLRPLLLWTDGQWDFDPRARLGEDMRITLDVKQLLLESARRLPAGFVVARLTSADETVQPAVAAPDGLQLLPAEAFVISRVDAPISMGELVAISGLPGTEAQQAIYALALGGLLQRDKWPRPFSKDVLTQARTSGAGTARPAPSSAPPAAAEKEPEVAKTPEPDQGAELEALFARAGGESHYQVLGVGRDASSGELKRVYYSLAKRFHPDRFHRDADSSMRSRIETAFAKISQAYEILKDEKTRKTYDLKLEALARMAQAKGASGSGSATASSTSFRAEESFKKGGAALGQGNQALALASFAEAARLGPKQARYRAQYGRQLARDIKTRRQAETELQAAIALDPRNVPYRVMLAELYRDIGLRRKAEAELERALSVDPQDAAARRLLDALKKAEAKT